MEATELSSTANEWVNWSNQSRKCVALIICVTCDTKIPFLNIYLTKMCTYVHQKNPHRSNS